VTIVANDPSDVGDRGGRDAVRYGKPDPGQDPAHVEHEAKIRRLVMNRRELENRRVIP
jgi:hypothetical protein